MVPESVTPESLIDVDNKTITTAPMEVLQQISKNSLMKMMIMMQK